MLLWSQTGAKREAGGRQQRVQGVQGEQGKQGKWPAHPCALSAQEKNAAGVHVPVHTGGSHKERRIEHFDSRAWPEFRTPRPRIFSNLDSAF